MTARPLTAEEEARLRASLDYASPHYGLAGASSNPVIPRLLATLDAARADLARVTGEKDEARAAVDLAGHGDLRTCERHERAWVTAPGLEHERCPWCERERAEGDFEAVCDALGMVEHVDGGSPMLPSRNEAAEAARRTMRALSDHDDERIPLSRESWGEEHGPVLWWTFPLREPPYAGTPLDDDFPEYVTHWTRITPPFDPVPECEDSQP